MTDTTTRTLPVASGSQVRRYVRRLLGGHPGGVAVVAIVVLAGSVAGLVGPWVLGAIVDVVAGESDRDLEVLVGVLVAVALVQAMSVWLGRLSVAHLGGEVLARTREHVVRTVLHHAELVAGGGHYADLWAAWNTYRVPGR